MTGNLDFCLAGNFSSEQIALILHALSKDKGNLVDFGLTPHSLNIQFSQPLDQTLRRQLNEITKNKNLASPETASSNPSYIISLISHSLTSTHLYKVVRCIAQNELLIAEITRKTPHALFPASASNLTCIEVRINGTDQNRRNAFGQLRLMTEDCKMDITFQKEDIYRQNRKLVCFDMDSTLIQVEVIDELAKAAGVGPEVIAITESAMRGERNFTDSFEKRVGLLRGLDESALKKIAEQLPLTPGAEKLLKNLNKRGYKTAILSGGFNYFANHLKERLAIDYTFANELEIEHGKVTGRVTGTVVDGTRKKELLLEIAHKERFSLEQVVAVGDGANDLPMLGVAGLGIAYHAKPLVKEQAQNTLSVLGLDAILNVMGIHQPDKPSNH